MYLQKHLLLVQKHFLLLILRHFTFEISFEIFCYTVYTLLCRAFVLLYRRSFINHCKCNTMLVLACFTIPLIFSDKTKITIADYFVTIIVEARAHSVGQRLSPLKPRVNFIIVFTCSFYDRRSQKRRKLLELTVFLCFWDLLAGEIDPKLLF